MTNSLKMAGFWILGTICIFIASIILSQLSTTDVLSLIISFLLILFGGLFWISVAVVAKE